MYIFYVDKTGNLYHASGPAAACMAGVERGGGVGRKK